MGPLWYECTKGDRDKPVLCFLHGIGGSSSVYSETVEYFSSRGYNILLIDLLGHGLSEKERYIDSYDFIAQCNHIKKIIDAEKIKKIVLIGHCLGSLICQEFCKLYEKNVIGLIVISSHYNICNNSKLQFKINIMKNLVEIFILLGLYKKDIKEQDTYSKFKKTSEFSPKRFF